MTLSEQNRLAARVKIIDEHIPRENLRDLDGIMSTYGKQPRFDDHQWTRIT